MYLLNGLSASGPTKPGTDSLHYLLYIITEADKLHVVDLDAHPGYFERVQKVRVLFDHTDYRFRVVVQRGGGWGNHGWVDICPFLRKKFESVAGNVIPKDEKFSDISKCWVTLVTEFRVHLLHELHRHTGVDPVTLADWVLKPEDICWEEPTYGAGGVELRNLLVDNGAEDVDGRSPFIISYWADNYLEFDTYKTARVFNGLVGYGEYLEDREDNHYSGADSGNNTNNFFVEHPEKRWLWKDIEGAKESDKTYTADRSNVLEAVIEKGGLTVTPEFSRMVHRRQQKTLDEVEDATVADIVSLFKLHETSQLEKSSRVMRLKRKRTGQIQKYS